MTLRTAEVANLAESESNAHARLSSIFLRLVDLPPEAQRDAIDRAGLDSKLLSELQALLRFHRTVTSPALNGDRLRAWVTQRRTFEQLNPGDTIGPYFIERVIGRGGSGTVYEARQTGAIERDVAIKVLDLPEPIEQRGRFAAERNAMAMLTHPGIAQVFDAGIDVHGRSYIVMERVIGRRLDQWLAAHPVSERQAVELILQLTDALTYAHGRGVIHRDVKPSNVLVVGEDNPAAVQLKLIDFGLVAAVGESAIARWLDRNDSEMLAGTPLFMAPEQARGDATPDVRTDVYGAGAILFWLLCGRAPIELSESHCESFAWLDVVANEPRLRIAQFRSDISRDVAAICENAIAPIEQRYASVEALATDLRRWKMRLPVTARPATRAYRLERFVSRNKIGVIVAAGVASVVIGSVTMIARALVRERHVNAELLAAKRTLEYEVLSHYATLNFISDDILNPDDAGLASPDMKLREVIDRAAPAVTRRFGDRPLAEAQVRRLLGGIYNRMGEFRKSAEMLAPCERLFADAGATDQRERFMAAATLGSSQKAIGDYDAAARSYQIALDITPGDESAPRVQAIAHAGMAQIMLGRHQTRDALHHSGRAVALYSKINPDVAILKHNWIEILAMHAWILSDCGMKTESQAMYARAAQEATRLFGADSAMRALVRANEAADLLDAGQHARAAEILADVLPIVESSSGRNGEQALQVMGNYVSALAGSDQAERAVAMALDLAQRVETVYGTLHQQTAQAEHRLAAALIKSGRAEDALPHADRAIEIAEKTYASGDWFVGQALATRAYAMGLSGRYREALDTYVRARPILATALGEENVRVKTVDQRTREFQAKLELKSGGPTTRNVP